MPSLFVAAVDEMHADDLITIYQEVPDDVALVLLDQGMIGRTREDAERFLTGLRDTNTPGSEDAQVFEIHIDV